jgi:pumilio family protein 6
LIICAQVGKTHHEITKGQFCEGKINLSLKQNNINKSTIQRVESAMTVKAEDRPKKMKTNVASTDLGKKTEDYYSGKRRQRRRRAQSEAVVSKVKTEDSPKKSKLQKQNDESPKSKKQKQSDNAPKKSKKQKQNDESPKSKKQKQSDNSPKKSKKQKPLREKIENKNSDLKEKIKIKNKNKGDKLEDVEKETKTESDKKAEIHENQKKLQEFFGPDFRNFKEEDARTVIELMKRHPEKRRDILKHLASHVNALVTKGCYNDSLVHTVLYNYMIGLNFQIAQTPDEKEMREKERTELISSLRDVCVHIVHSHDGARLTMNAIWHGTAKDRKAIIKSFKTFMVKISQEEHAYMSLIAILDAVDDTKLTGKAVLGELTANDEVLEGIIANSHSRKVLTFAMVGKCKTYFHPYILTNLGKGGDNSHSKNDAETRRSELADALASPLFSYINKNLDHILATNPLVIFLGGALLNAPNGNSEAKELLKNIAGKITQPFVPGDGSNLMENPTIHTLVKKILEKEDFYKLIMENMEPETLNSCIKCQRGAFLMVDITKLENPEAKKMVKSALKIHMKTLKKQSKLTSNKGAKVLLQKLAE